MRPGRGSWLIILLLAAIASSVIVMLTPDRQAPARTENRAEQGYYVREGTLTGTGPDGRMLYHITTKAARQNLDDGTIALEEVAVHYMPAARIPWDMRASSGQIPRDSNIIQLSGDVLVTSTASATANDRQVPLTIRTDYLELDPDTYIATTNRHVAIERSRDTLHARGMRVYLKQDRLQLESEVRGNFLP
ncbi:MAG: LPS export ABC transporter periplasmic protein LptC [Gammaproteobacteria bacterium]|jgi:LPS export ABC transporter protein LptC|nr:LPS export ABC transporter periplasmic protein LptC [Gammaproteobacteria bacterium]